MNEHKRVNAPVNGYTYVLEPGDGTRYKFTLLPYGILPSEVYGTTAGEATFFLAIHLSYDLVGCGTMTVDMVRSNNLPLHLDYLHSPGHGFSHVDKYTLAMCCLMAFILNINLSALDVACQYAMDNIQKVLKET